MCNKTDTDEEAASREDSERFRIQFLIESNGKGGGFSREDAERFLIESQIRVIEKRGGYLQRGF